jgi:D-aminopeptidase
LFRRHIQDDAPGAVLAVLNGSEVVLERAYGLADLAHAVPLDSRSMIRIGSQTKQFLVYVVLQLAREGRLSLDDRVGDHLSWPPATLRALRLRGLAANTSGVRDLLDLMVLAGICALGPVSRALERQVIGLSQELAAGEGEDLLYSNSNFLLLTDVVEAVAGAPFAELLTHYLSPLGMTETCLLSRDDEWIPRLAGQYRRGPEGRFLRGASLAAIGGEGGAVSALSDMVKWVCHLRAGHLAGDSIVRAMERTTTLGNGTPSPYGLGLVHTRHGGVEGIGHGGSVVGARSESTRFPAQDLAIVLLANREDLPVFALVRQILDILLRRPSAAELPDLLRASIASLSGQWREQEGGRVLVLNVDQGGATMTTSMGRLPWRRVATTSWRL